MPAWPDIRIRESARAGGIPRAVFPPAGRVYRYTSCNAPHASALRHLCAHKAHAPMPMEPGADAARKELCWSAMTFPRLPAAGGTPKAPSARLKSARAERQGDDRTLTIQGNAFLYNMVRIIAGTLMEVGTGNASRAASRARLQPATACCSGRPRPPAG